MTHTPSSIHPAVANRFPCQTWRKFNDGEELKATFIFPENHSLENGLAPGIFFLHGGFWKHGDISEFIPWAMHMAKHGIVSVLFEYRQADSYDIDGVDIIADGEEAWYWMLENASSLGIDLNKIVAMGNDAGGLMTLLLAMRGGKPSKKNPPRPVPSALITFRPLIDCTSKSLLFNYFVNPKDAKALSPVNLIRKNLPPLFIAAGGKEKIFSDKSLHKFVHSYQKKKNILHFLYMDEADHTFYQFDKQASLFEYTLKEVLTFLADREIIDPAKYDDDLSLVL